MKTFIINCFIIFLIFSSHSYAKERLIAEPTFEEVLQVYLKQEAMDYHAMQQWDKKMARSAWLPVLSLGYDRSLRETQAIAITDNISVSSAAVNVGPSDNNWDNSINQSDTIRMRAVWNLADLVFHEKTLSVSQEKRDLSRTRMSMSELLYKSYAERRLLVDKALRGARGSEACLKIDLLNQKMDAFTHNNFKSRWWGCGL